MSSKYELLASVVQADHDNWAYMNQTDGEHNHLVIRHILAILHDHAKYVESGSYVGPLDAEEIMDEIYNQIALNFTTVDFDEPVASATPEPTISQLVTNTHQIRDKVDGIATDELDIDS